MYQTSHNNEVSSVADSSQMIFRLQASPNWHAFDRSVFVLDVKVLKADGIKLGNTDMVSIFDNFGHSLMQQI